MSIAYQIKFIDNFKHMSQSLSNLVDNLDEPSKNLSIDTLINRFYNTYALCNKDINKFKLLLHKGIYPYEYMTSSDKYKEPVSLNKKLYYCKLNGENISDSDIEHVKKVCNGYKFTNLKDYTELYVKSDVSLLPDVFENYRDTRIKVDKLDPAYYLLAPGLSWHSCLKKTDIILELLTYEDMLLLCEKGICGGMCNVV